MLLLLTCNHMDAFCIGISSCVFFMVGTPTVCWQLVSAAKNKNKTTYGTLQRTYYVDTFIINNVRWWLEAWTGGIVNMDIRNERSSLCCH